MFKDLLGVDRAMVAYHKPKNLKYLVIPIRIKVCNEVDLKASTYSEKKTGRAMGVAVKDRVHEIFLDDKVSAGMREILNNFFNLVEQDIHYNSYKKKFMISARRSNDKDDRSQE